jgi:hypothetical protein
MMRLKFQLRGRGQGLHHRVTETQRTPTTNKIQKITKILPGSWAKRFFLVPLWPMAMLAGRKGMP